MGVLHSFSIKNVFQDKMDLKLFYFRVTIWEELFLQRWVFFKFLNVTRM